MFGEKPILIVEDDPYIATDLAMTVAEFDECVVGPFPTLREALAVVVGHRVDPRDRRDVRTNSASFHGCAIIDAT